MKTTLKTSIEDENYTQNEYRRWKVHSKCVNIYTNRIESVWSFFPQMSSKKRKAEEAKLPDPVPESSSSDTSSSSPEENKTKTKEKGKNGEFLR